MKKIAVALLALTIVGGAAQAQTMLSEQRISREVLDERERLRKEGERQYLERQESDRRMREERQAQRESDRQAREAERKMEQQAVVTKWEGGPRLTDGQARYINETFGGVYSQPDKYAYGIGSVAQSEFRVGVEGGRLYVVVANRNLYAVLDSIDERNSLINFRIEGGRMATMQRSPNMAMLTGYSGTQYLTWVRGLTDSDRDFAGIPAAGAAGAASHPGPSYGCGGSLAGVEQLICSSAELSALDVEMTGLYRRALDEGYADEKRALEAEQRGWVQLRNQCPRANCVREAYMERMAELEEFVWLATRTPGGMMMNND